MGKQGLFVGLTTLDLIYLVAGLPDRNQKIVAIDYTLAAGGPATNAAVTFRHLGHSATLLNVLGCHPLKHLVLADLQQQQVNVIDLEPDRPDPLPTSSICVTQATGERAVISLNATQSQAADTAIPPGILEQVDLVLIDGHQIAVGRAIAQAAQANAIPVVIDAGSWKPGFEQILPYASHVLCSANFYPPHCHTATEVFGYLTDLQVSHIAITQGEHPILFQSQNQSGQLPVPQIQAVDTSGAGDVFHGAFCHFMLRSSFQQALLSAAEVASYACQFFGTRQWMSSGYPSQGEAE